MEAIWRILKIALYPKRLLMFLGLLLMCLYGIVVIGYAFYFSEKGKPQMKYVFCFSFVLIIFFSQEN